MSTSAISSTASIGSISPSTASVGTTVPSLTRTMPSVGSSLSSGLGASSTPTSVYVSSGSSSYAPDSQSYFGASFLMWLVLAIIIALIVVNGFSYYTTGEFLFGEGIITSVGSITSGISTFVNNLMNSTEVGGKGVVEVSGETVKSAAAVPDQIVNGTQVNQVPGNKINQTVATGAVELEKEQASKAPNTSTTPLQKKINSQNSQIATAQRDMSRDIDLSGPQPNETSSTGSSNTSIGYCYIGEYNGERSCASVEDSTRCMSGNIFNTKDQCMKPVN